MGPHIGRIIEEVGDNSSFKIFEVIKKTPIDLSEVVIKLEIKCSE